MNKDFNVTDYPQYWIVLAMLIFTEGLWLIRLLEG